jgi:hypothetical protein
LKTCAPSNITVYRGHGREDKHIRKTLWFSTTTNKKVAKEEFAHDDCCVFTIHLRNVPIVNVYNHIERGRVGHEDEIIVLGEGMFYKDATCTVEGFRDRGGGEFETWYTIHPAPDIANIARELAEYREFIETADDIQTFQPGLTKEQREEVFHKM